MHCGFNPEKTQKLLVPSSPRETGNPMILPNGICSDVFRYVAIHVAICMYITAMYFVCLVKTIMCLLPMQRETVLGFATKFLLEVLQDCCFS